MVRVVNLTPHPVVVVGEECPSKVQSPEEIKPYIVATFPPSGKVARVTSSKVKVREVNGIPLYKSVFGEVSGLPDPQPGTIYIVSLLVLQALKGKRDDVVAPDTSPTGAVRDANGRIIAVKGFQVL